MATETLEDVTVIICQNSGYKTISNVKSDLTAEKYGEFASKMGKLLDAEVTGYEKIAIYTIAE
ncbi:MAG: hypothetical protein ACK5LT_12505 [Lachnospirales bacterium]